MLQCNFAFVPTVHQYINVCISGNVQNSKRLPHMFAAQEITSFFLNRWKLVITEWRCVSAGEVECNSSHQVSRNSEYS